MKDRILSVVLAMGLWSSAGYAQTMLYQQGFETPLSQNPEIKWGNRTVGGVSYPTQAIVTDRPKEGNKSVRGNFNRDVIDPITGIRGHEFTNLVVDFNNVPALKNWHKTTDKIYVSWWFKLDQVQWSGSSFNPTDPIEVAGKFAYLLMNNEPATSYYFTMNGGKSGTGSLSANSWNDLWQEWYNRPSVSSLTSGQSFGADGEWHKLSFYIYKNDTNQRRMKWWMDDKLMTRTFFENGSGDHRIYDGFVMDGIQFWHTATGNVGTSTAANVPNAYANGWQIDDLQVWDGIPPAQLPEPAGIALISCLALPLLKRRRSN